MTCLVNGKEWKSFVPGVIYPSVSAQYFEGDYFDLDVSNFDGIPGEIYLKIYGLKDTGTYLLGSYTQNYAQCNAYYVGNKLIQYVTDSIHTGLLRVTELDFPNRKISGNFEFEAFNKDSGDVMRITKGEFYLQKPDKLTIQNRSKLTTYLAGEIFSWNCGNFLIKLVISILQ